MSIIKIDSTKTAPSYTLPKALAWRRMTESEASTVDGIINATDARLRQIYMAAQYLDTSDELWPMLHGILSSAFGADRADELLAPET